jgi:xylulokinase
MERYIGIDVGTSSLKAVLVEIQEASVSVVREVSEPYSKDDLIVRTPEVWVECARSILAKLNAEVPRGIGFTGQMHSLIALSKERRVLPPSLLWLDMHGDSDLVDFVKDFPDQMVTRTGNIPLPDFTLAKWLYASRVNPRIRTETEMLLPAKDFVRLSLDPDSHGCTDPSEAAGTQLFNPFSGKWDLELVDRARIPRRALPLVVSASTKAGSGGAIAAAWGDAFLVVGAGDQAAAARAVGAAEEGVVSISLGTSAVISVPWKMASLPKGWDGSLHLLPGTEKSVQDIIATIPAFGPGLQWAARLLGGNLDDLDRWARIGDNDDRPLLFFPYLGGSGAPHPDIHRRGSFSGLDLSTTRESVARAIYDGFAMELSTLLDEIRRWGAPAQHVVLSGGASQLPTLIETIASFIDLPCFSVANPSASAIGAALLARDAVGTGATPCLPHVAVNKTQTRTVSRAWREARKRIMDEPPEASSFEGKRIQA